MYLVVALTGQGHTRAQETTATNQLVNVLDFFGSVRATAVLTRENVLWADSTTDKCSACAHIRLAMPFCLMAVGLTGAGQALHASEVRVSLSPDQRSAHSFNTQRASLHHSSSWACRALITSPRGPHLVSQQPRGHGTPHVEPTYATSQLQCSPCALCLPCQAGAAG